jgi:hypothetical protein
MTFYAWLLSFKRADTVRGDLARDIANDRTFPQDGDLPAFVNHLLSKGACEEAMDALRDAWRIWQNRQRKATMQTSATPEANKA